MSQKGCLTNPITIAKTFPQNFEQIQQNDRMAIAIVWFLILHAVLVLNHMDPVYRECTGMTARSKLHAN